MQCTVDEDWGEMQRKKWPFFQHMTSHVQVIGLGMGGALLANICFKPVLKVFHTQRLMCRPTMIT